MSIGDLVFADFDLDKKPDVVMSDPEGGRIAWLANIHGPATSAIFGGQQALPLPSGPNALAVLEADGGSAPELAVALGGPGPRLGIALLRAGRDAAGALKLEEYAYLPTTVHPVSLAAADLDGDGTTDLALLATATGGDSDGSVTPFLHDADGTWRALAPMPTGQRPYRLVAGDLDGDKRSEILVSAQNSHHVNLWIAREGGAFARAPDLGCGTGPLDLELADLDGDGRLEVIVANSFSDDLSVIRLR
jgi:hypothetical protein